MGRWPSQVSTVTEGIKGKPGQAGQVSGKQTPAGRAEETNTSQSLIELGENTTGVFLGLSSKCLNLFVYRITCTCWCLEHSSPEEAGGHGTKAAKSKQSKCPKVEYSLYGFASYWWWHFDKCIWTFPELEFYVAWIVMIRYHPGVKVLHLSGSKPIAGPGHAMFDYQYRALPDLWHSISGVYSDVVAMSKPRLTARWPFATGADCPLSVTRNV